jgi:hypothetical protein
LLSRLASARSKEALLEFQVAACLARMEMKSEARIVAPESSNFRVLIA